MSDMRYVPLGRSGLMVSAVGVGCNAFGTRIGADETAAVVDAAVDHGINFFDTADAYGEGASEQLLGRALGARRDEVVIATKFGIAQEGPRHWGAFGGRRYIRAAVEASLRRLGTDYIDLYQLHRPDPVVPVGETLQALTELVAEGKVRYIGSSNFKAWQVTHAAWTARTSGAERFISAQNEYSLYNRAAESELIPACESAGVGLLPYFPLAYGLLTGKYRRGEEPPAGSRLADSRQAGRLAGANWDRIEALRSFASERGITLLDLAIGALAARPTVAGVICGATRPEQVASNVAALRWRPDEADLAALDELGRSPAFS
jgi:aryl-alcohol dehydrogenase-like predicted oxidoreductase